LGLLNGLVITLDEADDYQVYGSKILYSFLWCNPVDTNASVSIYSQDLLKNLSFSAYPNDCQRLVLEFKRKNFVEFYIKTQTDGMNITTKRQLFFEFKEKVSDVLKASSLTYDCFNGSCVVKGFYQFQNVVGSVKVETPFHIYNARDNLSFEEKFYIGQSKTFDYYNNIYYAGDTIKRKLRLFNKLPEEKEEEPEIPTPTRQPPIQDTTLTFREKIFIIVFAVLIVLNLCWDFIKAKTRVDEAEENES
jgi:hypothetical protein